MNAVTEQQTTAESNPYSAAKEVDATPEVGHRSLTTLRLLVLLYAVVAVDGALQVLAYDNVTLYYLFTLLFVFVLTWWAVADSRERGAPLLPVLQLIYLVTCPVSTLIYLIATRGARGFGWALLNSVCLYLALGVAFYAMYYLLYFTGAWNLMDPVFVQP